MRAVHAAHRADADQRLDHVVTAERRADQRVALGDDHLSTVEWTTPEVGPVTRAAGVATAQRTDLVHRCQRWLSLPHDDARACNIHASPGGREVVNEVEPACQLSCLQRTVPCARAPPCATGAYVGTRASDRRDAAQSGSGPSRA